MRFIVFGASGYVGGCCYDYLESSKFKVIGTQNTSKLANLRKFDLSNDRVKDIVDKSFLDKNDKVFGIIFAAFSEVDRCFREKEKSYKINVESTIKLIEDLVNLGIKPVYISTSAVFDGNYGYYKDNSKFSPVCEYGRQKVKVEEYIHQNIKDYLIFRLDKVLGDIPSKRNLFSQFQEPIDKQQPLLCMEGQIFAPTHNNDIPKAIALACKKDLKGTFNLANTEFFSRFELIRQFALSIGKECKIICKPQEEFNFADKRNPKSYLDSSKFIKSTGFNFTPMSEVLENYKKNSQHN